MKTSNLGYPRIGDQRELKKANENFWAGKITLDELKKAGKAIRIKNWKTQHEAGIDLIPSNDFSYYDQVLDMCLTVGAIPERYKPLQLEKSITNQALYFAMARGYQKEGIDVTAMEMTKWFDTNYHYIVPEFKADQQFELLSTKVVEEYSEAKEAGIQTKPVLIGPVTFLLLGKEKEAGFHRLTLLDKLIPVYTQLLKQLEIRGAEWVQIDEPILSTDLNDKDRAAIKKSIEAFKEACPKLKLLLANYFDCYGENLELALSLPVDAIHLDLVRCPAQLGDVLNHKKLPDTMVLSLGVVDGRNIWKNEFEDSLGVILKAVSEIGEERIIVAPSCSLLHSPCDLDIEQNEKALPLQIKNWLSFAKQKIEEIVTLAALASGNPSKEELNALEQNREAHKKRNTSPLIHKKEVNKRVEALKPEDSSRKNPFSRRKILQQEALNLPAFPTTTIGSFPQTQEVRKQRAKFRKKEISAEAYETFLKEETLKAIKWQEEIGLDVLVHGEFERNDMVEYFGEKLEGVVFTQYGWVQSYGSRCVKPPIIFGDITRPKTMTVNWSSYAQKQTTKWMKGMLTGPVTILQWSFVRDDQPRSETCTQLALAIRDEVKDLENAGIKIIQVDEPAIREGLPLRKADWDHYLNWAVRAFRIATSNVEDTTQIHTHMCYSEFNDIIQHIANMDADVITIECSRSQMELLDAFAAFNYPNEIGPGVYDIHSPRVPKSEEMLNLLNKAKEVIPANQLWVNPDCGLKTRHWEETKQALIEMVGAAKQARNSVEMPVA